jgi:hypothetical protein
MKNATEEKQVNTVGKEDRNPSLPQGRHVVSTT